MSDKKETGVALHTLGIPTIIEKLREELKALKKQTDQPPHTNGRLDLGGGQVINIQTETKVENLVKALGVLLAMRDYYNKSQQELGVSEIPAFSVGGSVEHWTADMKVRIAFLQHENREKELNALIDEASKFVSAEDQKIMFLEKLSKTLGK